VTSRGRPTERRPRRRPVPIPGADPPTRPLTAIERFRGVDEYRVGREWRRYEGTAQRELFRSLRDRFLRRNAASSGWVLDLGSGPGRFTPLVGAGEARRVAMELAMPMLDGLRTHWPAGLDRPELVLADGREMPFRPRSFSEVAVLGNAIGFAGEDAFRLLETAAERVGPGGRLLVETAPGPGTASRYLRRLPSGAMVRLLRAPTAAVAPRVTREGFEVLEREDKTRHGFRPVSESELTDRLTESGFVVREAISIAPALGDFPERVEDVRAEPGAWERLLLLEERLGALPVARREAAALLVAAERSATRAPTVGVRGIK
jgi:SAM-dependent methyltransferase